MKLQSLLNAFCITSRLNHYREREREREEVTGDWRKRNNTGLSQFQHFTNYENHIKDNEMAEACNTQAEIRNTLKILVNILHTRVYPKVSELAAWSENCKWYSSLPLCAVVSLFCESL
jgi:hypothetical protein